jgi:type VI secretion system secreted protein VgrG
MEIAAKGLIDVISANSHINWAAAKRIVIKTAGGACIDISGGNIDVSCPGTLTIKAGAKSFTGPQVSNFALPQMPRSVCVPCLRSAMESGSPLVALS